MTILTQGISNKKLLNKPSDSKPLVGAVEASAPKDIESGSTASLASIRIRAQRVNNLTTLCVTLTALIVLTTGIVGGIYLYRQFAQYRLRHFRGWCTIPYVEPNQRYHDLHAMQSEPAIETHDLRDNNGQPLDIESLINDLSKQMDDTFRNNLPEMDHSFDEEFDIDVELQQYERIEVPNFSHGRRGRFVHDFSTNKTGIVDLDEERCFVLPLNRSQVLPPQSLFDLVVKMKSGYYDIDTQIVRDLYRVVTPPITDFKNLGYYIARECATLPTYRLERITSPVYKRSIDENENKKVIFSEFAGKGIHEFQIVNLHDAKGNK
ncbi:integral membrane protein 2B-like [Oppia nitens]|uniref:integral membrane protein 2B-like n=1 Tax=Oppia nitens TaxID=1686743 RepID=UPI0023DB900B|nr:integral membrane protein 2B-like [Oppia nitens]